MSHSSRVLSSFPLLAFLPARLLLRRSLLGSVYCQYSVVKVLALPISCQCPLRNKNPFLYILSGVPSAKYSLVTDFRCYPKFLGVFNDTAGSLVLSSANSGFNPWFSSSARGSACVFKVPALPRSAQERILPASKDMSREFAGNFANWLTCF
jgi:hypothetical protein